MGVTTNNKSSTTESPLEATGVDVALIYLTGQVCALVGAVVKTKILLSSHCGHLACAKLKSSFNKSAEKMLTYQKDKLIYYTQ